MTMAILTPAPPSTPAIYNSPGSSLQTAPPSSATYDSHGWNGYSASGPASPTTQVDDASAAPKGGAAGSANLIPVPQADRILEWVLNNPQALIMAIQMLNALNSIKVSVVTNGTSRFQISPNGALLTISTKDIKLGIMSGLSTGSGGAATKSIAAQLAATFGATNSVT
jgi:hypothetical protein